VIHPDLHHTRDAPVAAALVLQHLVDEGTTLSAAVDKWPAYTIVKKKIDFPREALPDAYGELERQLASDGVDLSDGARFHWVDRQSWLHVRPSGTEPIVRLIAEAPGRTEAEELVERAEEILKPFM